MTTFFAGWPLQTVTMPRLTLGVKSNVVIVRLTRPAITSTLLNTLYFQQTLSPT